ncbi:MAG TPA: hypothetical protein VIY69_02150 [Candidatus Acidoferrales bacterium]
MPQLYGRDLRSGDILLEWNAGATVHKIIRFGQKLMNRGSEELIHAAILFDNRYLIDSTSDGITASDIYLQAKEYSYSVYRPNNPALAAGAATCARICIDIDSRTKGMSYSYSGALTSIFKGPGVAPSRDAMDSAFGQLLKGKNHPFFCSQFVVFIFQFVAEQNNLPAEKIFPYGDGCVPPSLLGSRLKSHPLFTEVGYMRANQR